MVSDSVIAAISTPPGKGGVALIRVSGDGAIEICSKVFYPKSKASLSDIPSRMQVYGDIVKGGECIDDGMATVFRAPASYTGEDTVEISCHGGSLVTARVLEAVFLAGARAAERGEFTERAFINGKLSLSDAEGIGNLIEAKSDDQIRLSAKRARTELDVAIQKIRGSLTSVLASLFARIDYPDEDLGEYSNEQVLSELSLIKESIDKLIATYPTARAINEGVKTVIVGKPNVGKSSLYNALLGTDAAIVTNIKGTTRDVLTDTVSLGKIMLKLSDTAGIRDANDADEIEKIGIERSIETLENAELILAVFDISSPCDDDDFAIISRLNTLECPKVAVLNKDDLTKEADLSAFDSFDSLVTISAKSDPSKARGSIASVTDKLFTDEKISIGTDAIITTARQNCALISASEYIKTAINAFGSGQYTDAAASEIELALGFVSEIDGRAVAEEVLDEIFSKYCVGK